MYQSQGRYRASRIGGQMQVQVRYSWIQQTHAKARVIQWYVVSRLVARLFIIKCVPNTTGTEAIFNKVSSKMGYIFGKAT